MHPPTRWRKQNSKEKGKHQNKRENASTKWVNKREEQTIASCSGICTLHFAIFHRCKRNEKEWQCSDIIIPLSALASSWQLWYLSNIKLLFGLFLFKSCVLLRIGTNVFCSGWIHQTHKSWVQSIPENRPIARIRIIIYFPLFCSVAAGWVVVALVTSPQQILFNATIPYSPSSSYSFSCSLLSSCSCSSSS